MALVSRVSSFCYKSKTFILKCVLLPLFLLSIAALAAANLLLLKLFFSSLCAAAPILVMARSYNDLKKKLRNCNNFIDLFSLAAISIFLLILLVIFSKMS